MVTLATKAAVIVYGTVAVFYSCVFTMEYMDHAALKLAMFPKHQQRQMLPLLGFGCVMVGSILGLGWPLIAFDLASH